MSAQNGILKDETKYEAILEAHIKEIYVLDLPHLRSFSHLVNEAIRVLPANKKQYHDVLCELERVRDKLMPIVQAKIAEKGNRRLGGMPNINISTLFQKITEKQAA